MLTESEAKELMAKLIELRDENNVSPSPEKEKALKQHENKCIREFSYLVSTHTNRYKKFSNYDDLVQEGYVAMLNAFASFNPNKNASVFFWLHKYIGTRVARQANLHTVIRYPLKIAKEHVPRREYTFPLMIEETFCPDKQSEFSEIAKSIKNSMKHLRGNKRKIITWYFGFHGDKPYSINKICETLDIPRNQCIKLFHEALDKLREVVKI